MAIPARSQLCRAAAAASLVAAIFSPAARADVPHSMTEEAAHQAMPRADVSGLTDEQRGVLFDIAGDTIDYAGCNSTLAACLRADQKDKHAPRMAKLAALMLMAGYTDTQVKYFLDEYYGSFAKERRQTLNERDCPIYGEAKAPVTLTEFSDYQCPHCARAVKPIHDLLESYKGKVKLCSKYFPLPGHPRAMQAAAAAEYAREHKKFWEMHEMLFANQERLEDADLKSYAKKLGLDGDEMVKQIYAHKFDDIIERTKKEGLDAKVDSTPSVFFNGRLMTLPGMQFLGITLEDELEWQRNNGAWDKQ